MIFILSERAYVIFY